MKAILFLCSFSAVMILLTSCPDSEYGCPPYCTDTCCCDNCDMDTCDISFCEGCCCEEGVECLVDTCKDLDMVCEGCCCEEGVDCYTDICPPEYCNKHGSFELLLGGYGEEEGWGVIRTSDGNYVLAGRYSDLTNLNYNIYLVKIDTGGILMWARHSLYEKGDDEYAVDILELPNRDLLVLGNQAKNRIDKQVILLKTDKDGVTHWEKDFGLASSDLGWSVITGPDAGSYLISGSSDIYGSIRGWEAIIWEIGSDGSPGSRLNFGKLGDDYGSCIEVDQDGNYLLLASVEKDEGGFALVLYKLDQHLQKIIWEKDIISSSLPEQRACIRSIGIANGTAGQASYVVAAAVVTGEMRVVLVNANGSMPDYSTYTDISISESVSVIVTVDGGFAVLTNEMVLLKLNNDLSVEWTREFEGRSHGAHRLLQTDDGGFIMIGTKHNEVTNSDDLYVVKTDSEGML